MRTCRYAAIIAEPHVIEFQMTREIADVEQRGDVWILTPIGPYLDADEVCQLENLLQSISVRDDCQRIVIRFRSVDTAYHALLHQLLVKTYKRLSANGGSLTLCELTPHLLEAIRLDQLDRIIHIANDLEEAIAAFPP